MSQRAVDSGAGAPAGAPAETPEPGAPYVYRRRVRWGDGDPAMIVYTVRFLDYVMEAVEGWFREVTGNDWFAFNTELGIGTPVVHLDMDFHAPLRPGDELSLSVLVERIGRASLQLGFRGALNGAAAAYSGRLVLAFISRDTMRATAAPPAVRRAIERYAAACRRGAET